MTALAQDFVARPIAHRGFHNLAQGRPENSLAAGLAAVSRGYAIEIDVQLSADGVAVVFHDHTLDRMTPETGHVVERTADELSTIPLRGGERSTQTVPSLGEFLRQVGGRAAVVIEIKDQSGVLGPTDGALEQAVARDLSQLETADAVAVMSFNPYSIEHMATLAPGIARGLVTDPFTKEDWPDVPDNRRQDHSEITMFRHLDASFISHNVDDLGSQHVARLKSEGAKILCWTVKSQSVEDTARTIADNITFEGYEPAPALT